MLTFVVLLLAACAYGQRPQLHNTCHCNHRGLNEETVVNQLVVELDRNGDKELVIGEVVVGLAHILNLTLSVSDEVILEMNDQALIALATLTNAVNVNQHDFVAKWIAHFGDCASFVEAVFVSFDENRDQIITIRELEGILFHVREVAGNFDSHITTTEFHDFFLWLYRVEGC